MSSIAMADSLLERVNQIAPLLREQSAEAERQRRLPRPVFEAMRNAGLYNMARPKAFGGLELDPLTMFEVIEAIARHDSAAAWNLQIATGGHAFPAWFSDETASEIFDVGPDVVIAGSF